MASYLYAIVRTADGARTDCRGIDGAPLRAVSEAGLTGVVSTVDAAQFGAERDGGVPGDMRWLEDVARAHDEVVRAVAQGVAAVPLRLGVVCSDDEAVAERLRDVADDVTALLARVDGHDEWGVKIFAAPDREPAAAGAAMSGTAYLQRRREMLQRSARSSAAAVAAADRIVAGIAEDATATQRHPPQDPRLSGARGAMLANVAFLIRRERRRDFETSVSRAGGTDPALEIVVTGPWPPYSFTVGNS